MHAPWNRAPAVAETRKGGALFVLNLASRTGQPVMLDGTALDVWEVVDERTTQEIVDHLAAEYGVAALDIEGPVLAFLSQLSDLGLIRRQPDGRG
jgi:uncharacterized protein (DUF433 family)